MRIIKSFHEGMHAVVRTGTDSIEVWNGLRQGCTLAPTLFNIYFSAMVANWRDGSLQAGVSVKFKHGRKFVGDRTAKSRLGEVRMTKSQFADDVAAYAKTRDAFERVTREVVQSASKWGLTVSLGKTKGLVVGQHVEDSDVMEVQLEGGTVAIVEDFNYLGSNIARDGEIRNEVSNRIAKAARVFGCLRRPIFQNTNLSLATKRSVYRAAVLPALLYGAETWTIKAEHVKRLNIFHNCCVSSG